VVEYNLMRWNNAAGRKPDSGEFVPMNTRKAASTCLGSSNCLRFTEHHPITFR